MRIRYGWRFQFNAVEMPELRHSKFEQTQQIHVNFIGYGCSYAHNRNQIDFNIQFIATLANWRRCNESQYFRKCSHLMRMIEYYKNIVGWLPPLEVANFQHWHYFNKHTHRTEWLKTCVCVWVWIERRVKKHCCRHEPHIISLWSACLWVVLFACQNRPNNDTHRELRARWENQ